MFEKKELEKESSSDNSIHKRQRNPDSPINSYKKFKAEDGEVLKENFINEEKGNLFVSDSAILKNSVHEDKVDKASELNLDSTKMITENSNDISNEKEGEECQVSNPLQDENNRFFSFNKKDLLCGIWNLQLPKSLIFSKTINEVQVRNIDDKAFYFQISSCNPKEKEDNNTPNESSSVKDKIYLNFTLLYLNTKADEEKSLNNSEKQAFQNLKEKIKSNKAEKVVRTPDPKEPTFDITFDILVINLERFKARTLRLVPENIYEITLSLKLEKINQEIPNEDVMTILLDMIFYKDFSHLKNKEREVLGYIGIVNEGMTCYMNSMLQTLNILGSFKTAIFKVPTANKNYESSICLSLQRTFYDLMYEKAPIKTDKLTDSFGWSQDEVNVQHDVQEFNLKLSDALENGMNGTVSDGFYASMFQGKTIDYIDCINIKFKSTKIEKFCDLSLPVKVIFSLNFPFHFLLK